MKKQTYISWKMLVMAALLILLLGLGQVFAQGGESSQCENIDSKPTLDVAPMDQAELVHLYTSLSGLDSPENGYPTEEQMQNLSPEDLYNIEAQILANVCHCVPESFLDSESSRIVSRDVFVEFVYSVAMAKDENFASSCGGLTSQGDKMNCLMDSDYLSANNVNDIYSNEVLNVLCVKKNNWTPCTPDQNAVNNIANQFYGGSEGGEEGGEEDGEEGFEETEDDIGDDIEVPGSPT